MTHSFRISLLLLLISSASYTTYMAAMEEEKILVKDSIEEKATVVEEQQVDAVDNCAICLNALNHNDMLCAKLHCGHTSHKACIEPFFKLLFLVNKNFPLGEITLFFIVIGLLNELVRGIECCEL